MTVPKGKAFYITTAIDYVNSSPHCGHAYEKIVSDVIARWQRLLGKDVFFLTGTDENAQKNEQAARKAGIPVKKFVDKNSTKFEKLCQKLNLSHDDFIRTTQERHVKVSRAIFQKLLDKGDIYKGFYEGYYCVGCEGFKTEKDLVDGKCPEHDTKPEWLKEESYFFKMSKYTDFILKLLQNKNFVVPDYRRIEMLNRVKSEGLRDLSVSRTKLKWGITTPNDPNSKIYVWLDALINYISALGYPDGERFKKYWPADIHMIGKGINWFHSVIWPSILKAADVEMPKTVLVHGYTNLAGKKMSNSKGAVIDPFEIIDRYGSDALRYFLIKEIPFGEDGDFSEEALSARINGELLSDLGNLASRVLTLAEKYKGEVKGKPEMDKKLQLEKIKKHMEKYELHFAMQSIMGFVRATNKYINENEPWKQEGKELGNTMYNLLESLRIIGILIQPFMPTTAERINEQLGVKHAGQRGHPLLSDCAFKPWKGKVKKGEHLFKPVKN
jgi:methionyl-tRNA synthetase